MRPPSAAFVFSAVSIWDFAAALGVQKAVPQVAVTVGGSGDLVRRQHRSSLAPDGLQWSQALQQGYVWPVRDRTALKSSWIRRRRMAATDEADLVREDVPSGAVCPTWLNEDIQHENLKPFINSTGVDADGFVAELSRLCGGRLQWQANYSGTWKDNPPTPNDVRVLKGLTKWAAEEKAAGRSKIYNWANFSKPDKGHSLAAFVQNVMSHPTNITASGPRRILDFGCGEGTDIVALQGALNTTVENTLCMDVFPIHRPDVTPTHLDATNVSTYHNSLEKALEGNENTVHVAISMVAFHHIPDPQMRADALVFLRKVLRPGGIFIMAEWDNSVKPNRQIHYDLVHVLPSMLFSGDAPRFRSELEIGTDYLSVQKWITTASEAGLQFDEERSRAHGMGPKEMAAIPGNPNRDFHIVFKK